MGGGGVPHGGGNAIFLAEIDRERFPFSPVAQWDVYAKVEVRVSAGCYAKHGDLSRRNTLLRGPSTERRNKSRKVDGESQVSGGKTNSVVHAQTK